MILTCLLDQISAQMDVQLKILQTILPLVTNYSNVSESNFATALLIAHRLQDPKVPILHATAAVTFRQLIVFAFERVVQHESWSDSLSKRDAVAIFNDLCQLAVGQPACFLEIDSLKTAFVTELLESVILVKPQLFIKLPELFDLLKNIVYPFVMNTLSEKKEFNLQVRLIRLTATFVLHFHTVLSDECEKIMSAYHTILDSETHLWQKVLVLEIFKSITLDPNLPMYDNRFLDRSLFNTYDALEESGKKLILKDLIQGISQFILRCKSFLLENATEEDTYQITLQDSVLRVKWFF